MEHPNLKNDAHRLVDSLADDATWDDLMYEIYVRQAIEAGRRDSEENRVTGIEKVREKYGLSS